jgi:hypothetical protein
MVSWSKLTFKGAVQPTALSWTTCIAPRPELAPFLLFAAPHQFGSDRRRSGHSQRRICVFGRPVPFATVNPVNLNLAPGPGEVGRAGRPHFARPEAARVTRQSQIFARRAACAGDRRFTSDNRRYRNLWSAYRSTWPRSSDRRSAAICPESGGKRKSLAHARNDVNDPTRPLAARLRCKAACEILERPLRHAHHDHQPGGG